MGFTCTVTTDSTMTSVLPINVSQCNDAANGGGALVNCTATVTNVFLTQVIPPTPIPTALRTPVPTPAPTAVPTVGPTPALTPIPGVTPVVAAPVAPQPAATGNVGLIEEVRIMPILPLLAGITALGLALLASGRFVTARRRK